MDAPRPWPPRRSSSGAGAVPRRVGAEDCRICALKPAHAAGGSAGAGNKGCGGVRVRAGFAGRVSGLRLLFVYCIAKCTTLCQATAMAGGTTSGVVKRKEYPLSMRLPEGDIAIIDRAADLRGRSRTDFMREAAVRAAEEVLMESMLLRMSPDGFAAFVQAVSAPAAPVPEMVASLRRTAPWEEDTAKR